MNTLIVKGPNPFNYSYARVINVYDTTPPAQVGCNGQWFLAPVFLRRSPVAGYPSADNPAGVTVSGFPISTPGFCDPYGVNPPFSAPLLTELIFNFPGGIANAVPPIVTGDVTRRGEFYITVVGANNATFEGVPVRVRHYYFFSQAPSANCSYTYATQTDENFEYLRVTAKVANNIVTHPHAYPNTDNKSDLESVVVDWGDGTSETVAPAPTGTQGVYSGFSVTHDYHAGGTYLTRISITDSVGRVIELNRTITFTAQRMPRYLTSVADPGGRVFACVTGTRYTVPGNSGVFVFSGTSVDKRQALAGGEYGLFWFWRDLSNHLWNIRSPNGFSIWNLTASLRDDFPISIMTYVSAGLGWGNVPYPVACANGTRDGGIIAAGIKDVSGVYSLWFKKGYFGGASSVAWNPEIKVAGLSALSVIRLWERMETGSNELIITDGYRLFWHSLDGGHTWSTLPYGEVWGDDFVYTCINPACDGGLIASGVKAEGEIPEQEFSLWFRRGALVAGGIEWETARQIAEIDIQEPYDVLQLTPSGSFDLLLTNGHDKFWRSPDLGRNWNIA